MPTCVLHIVAHSPFYKVNGVLIHLFVIFQLHKVLRFHSTLTPFWKLISLSIWYALCCLLGPAPVYTSLSPLYSVELILRGVEGQFL